MRLEVGKKYVRRDGEVSGVVWKTTDDDYPYYDGEFSYCSNGCYLLSEARDTRDLISEYTEPKQTGFVVGETYTCDNGNKVVCIHITDDKAYCAGVGFHGAAYTWSLDGEYLNALPEDRAPYRITFAPKVEWVTTKNTYVDDGIFLGHFAWDEGNQNLNITFPLIDGKPDWSQAKIEVV